MKTSKDYTVLFQVLVSILMSIIIGGLLKISPLLTLFLIIAGTTIVIIYFKYFSQTPIMNSLVKLLLFFSLTGSSLALIDIGNITLFPDRVLLPVVIFLFLIQYIKDQNQSLSWNKIHVKPILAFFLIWIFYSIISLLWVESLTLGVRDIYFLVSGIALIYFTVFYLSKLKDYVHLFYIWLFMFLCLSIVGIWENITKNHLSNSSLINAPDYMKDIPTAVFHNQNDFATYISISLFFIIAFIKYANKNSYKVFGALLLIVSLYLMYLTNSRANFLALAIAIVLYLLFIIPSKYRSVYVLVGLSAGLVSLVYLNDKLFVLISKVVQGVSSTIDSSFSEGSLNIRVNLIKNSLAFLSESLGFGVGAGNVNYYLEHSNYFPINNIYNVHNWWIELLTNYGLIIFFGYILTYITIIVKTYQINKILNNKVEKMICEALLGGLFVFPLAVISPSSIMTLKFQWFFLAFVIGFINYCRKKNKAL